MNEFLSVFLALQVPQHIGKITHQINKNNENEGTQVFGWLPSDNIVNHKNVAVNQEMLNKMLLKNAKF